MTLKKPFSIAPFHYAQLSIGDGANLPEIILHCGRLVDLEGSQFRSSVLRLFRAFALLRPNPRLLAMLPCWTFSLELSPTDCASGIRLLSVSPLRLRKRLRISCSLAQALTLFEIVVNLSDAIIILLGYIRPTPMFPR